MNCYKVGKVYEYILVLSLKCVENSKRYLNWEYKERKRGPNKIFT